jgi:hypothetical protein
LGLIRKLLIQTFILFIYLFDLKVYIKHNKSSLYLPLSFSIIKFTEHPNNSQNPTPTSTKPSPHHLLTFSLQEIGTISSFMQRSIIILIGCLTFLVQWKAKNSKISNLVNNWNKQNENLWLSIFILDFKKNEMYLTYISFNSKNKIKCNIFFYAFWFTSKVIINIRFLILSHDLFIWISIWGPPNIDFWADFSSWLT